VVALEGPQVVSDADHAAKPIDALVLAPGGFERRRATVPLVSSPVESTAAELAAIADNVEQYRRRVGDLAERFVGSDRDDLVAAIHEAERLLRTAERGLIRALRVAN
jgi:hypothetical protein